MLRLAFDFIITWRETRTRPNAYNISMEMETIRFLLLYLRMRRLIRIYNQIHLVII